MRKVELILLFLILSLTVFAQKPDPGFFDKMALQEQMAFAKKSAFIENEKSALTDFIYQRMEWKIDPEVLFIEGVVTTYFNSKTDSLNEITFDLHAAMVIDSVVHNNIKLPFSRNKNEITITLPNLLSMGETDSVSLFYNGTPDSSGFGAFSKTLHNNIPNVWTLSEPYGAMEWWPCKQSLVDKIDSIDIIVTSPKAYRTASVGVLVSETINGDWRQMHWKHRFPIATYLVAISVTNYEDYSDTLALDDGREIEILNYVYPEHIEEAKTKTPVTTQVMALYNELIGEYPFATEKYGHAQFGWGGGMEHQTMSFMYNFGYELIAHELAHQWFGDYITLGSWQDIWLNEGFATYLTGLSYEHLLDGVWWPIWKKINVDYIVSEPDGSVFVTDTTDIGRLFSGRLSYSKGAYVLHMLRWVLGDNAFFAGMQNYFNNPEIANGFARTSQFVDEMETAGDTTLTEFFDDWLYGEGFPVYSVHFSNTPSSLLKIVLTQIPSHESVSFFEMPVPIRVFNATKTDSADFRLVNTRNNQEFIVEPGFAVAYLKIDPDYWLVSKTDEIVAAPTVVLTEEMTVFPNPFANEISIELEGDPSIISTQIFTLDGSLVKTVVGSGKNINLSNLSPGTYLLHVKTRDRMLRQQIVKQ